MVRFCINLVISLAGAIFFEVSLIIILCLIDNQLVTQLQIQLLLCFYTSCPCILRKSLQCALRALKRQRGFKKNPNNNTGIHIISPIVFSSIAEAFSVSLLDSSLTNPLWTAPWVLTKQQWDALCWHLHISGRFAWVLEVMHRVLLQHDYRLFAFLPVVRHCFVWSCGLRKRINCLKCKGVFLLRKQTSMASFATSCCALKK